MGPKPPYVEETGVSPESASLFDKLWSEIGSRGTKSPADPIVAGILEQPEMHRVMGVRAELLNIVHRTLLRMGCIGTVKGKNVQTHLQAIIRRTQEGGLF